MTTSIQLTRETVPENHRLDITNTLFGNYFPMYLKPTIYSFADKLSEEYHGGYWEFYVLSNGGFYMAPLSNRQFHVICDNQFEGDLSDDALGITVCLYAYSHLSFSGTPRLANTCYNQYHLLREFMLEHSEARAILGAID